MRQFEPLSQNDPRWKDLLLGLSDRVTLGQAGCFVTSFAILAYYYGHQVLPDAMNQQLINANLFANQDLISSDDDLHKLFPDINFLETIHCENAPADLNVLKDLVADLSKSVIVEIDLGNGQVHFTPVLACDGTNVTIQNVWDGKIEDLKSQFGDPATKILKYVVYQGTPASDPAPDTLMEIKQSDFIKIDQKSLELDKIGAAIGFNQEAIDSLGFADKVIAKYEQAVSSASSQPAPEGSQSPESSPVQPLTPPQVSIVQRFLSLLGVTISK